MSESCINLNGKTLKYRKFENSCVVSLEDSISLKETKMSFKFNRLNSIKTRNGNFSFNISDTNDLQNSLNTIKSMLTEVGLKALQNQPYTFYFLEEAQPFLTLEEIQKTRNLL